MRGGVYEIEVRLSSAHDDAPDRFEDFVDAVADELDKIGVEPDYAASVTDLTTVWWVEVPDASETSLIGALSSLRSAFTAAMQTEAYHVEHQISAARHLAPA